MKTILSIQSHTAFGHAGNSAAVFPMQRSGVDVIDVLTVNFSNHTGYGKWRGILVPADEVWNVVQGVDERGALSRVDALLSGYQGAGDVGAVVLRAADLVKQRNPAAIWCCDPVMGDVGRGFYAAPGIPEFMRDHVTPKADVMTPNLFELQFLTGTTTRTLADVLAAARQLREMGPQTVLVTSVTGEDMDPTVMRMLAVTGEGAWQVETPNIDQAFTGSGDVTAAMFLTHLLNTGSAAAALEATASIVYSLLARTHELGQAEMALVAAQDEIVHPSHTFEATRL